ncbi:MAG: hypothetical protein ACKVS9_00300 [Phycisphaerae bacterium]
MHDGGCDDFFVGYLATPPALRRFLWRITPTALLLSIALAWLVTTQQRDPGTGVWQSGQPREYTGLIIAEPYPHLCVGSQVGESQPGGIEIILLVEVGKFGGGQRAAAFDGRIVTLTGWPLERDGRRMIELEPGDTIRTAADDSDARRHQLKPQRKSIAPATLRGEIVDSKCYLGAMKPGKGKPHKECATLCIAGGIPPMLVSTDAGGSRTYSLLCDRDRRALDIRLLPFVADWIELTGMRERWGDLDVLLIDVADLRRL